MRKSIILAWVICILLISCAYAKDNYLGEYSNNTLDPDSTSNPVGQYGSTVSPKSINNPIGKHGSPVSPYSSKNPLGTNPPKLYDE